MKKHKKYIERNDLKGMTHLEVEVFYDLGGYSAFAGGIKPRGYYISVTPVNMSGNMISFTAFSGQGRLLFETKRFTAKQFERAKDMSKDFEGELIASVAERNKAA
jgi:hypothetical protein